MSSVMLAIDASCIAPAATGAASGANDSAAITRKASSRPVSELRRVICAVYTAERNLEDTVS